MQVTMPLDKMTVAEKLRKLEEIWSDLQSTTDEIHQEDLIADWELAVNGRTPFKIKGLDQ